MSKFIITDSSHIGILCIQNGKVDIRLTLAPSIIEMCQNPHGTAFLLVCMDVPSIRKGEYKGIIIQQAINEYKTMVKNTIGEKSVIVLVRFNGSNNEYNEDTICQLVDNLLFDAIMIQKNYTGSRSYPSLRNVFIVGSNPVFIVGVQKALHVLT